MNWCLMINCCLQQGQNATTFKTYQSQHLVLTVCYWYECLSSVVNIKVYALRVLAACQGRHQQLPMVSSEIPLGTHLNL